MQAGAHRRVHRGDADAGGDGEQRGEAAARKAAEEERERIRGLSAEERRAEGRPPKPCTGCAQGCPDCERRPSASLDTEAEARARERRRAEIYALNHIMRDYFRGLGAVD